MQDDPRYQPVEEALPRTLPPVTRVAVLCAARKITRHFGGVKYGEPHQHFPVPLPTHARFGWASSKPTSGHWRGWGRMIHDVSHRIFRYRHPAFKPHAGGHSTLEREIAEYVAKSGWLEVKQPNKATLEEKRAKQLAHNEQLTKRWLTKQKRATTALRKLKRQRTRLMKVQVA